MKKLGSFLVCLIIFVAHPFAVADEYRGVDFPCGDVSFSDVVVSYEPDFNGGTGPDTTCMKGDFGPTYATGPPDHYFFAPLAEGGRITLKFVDNFLIGSGDDEADLWIFEIGGPPLSGVAERTFVDISKDGIIWHSLGAAEGGTVGFDIDGFGFGAKDYFSFVRLTDDLNQNLAGPCVGADIDAVGASSCVPISKNGEVIFHDDFDGPLDPIWTAKLGDAWTEDGWVYLNHPIPFDPYRDSVLMTGEDDDWSDYRIRTRFYAETGTSIGFDEAYRGMVWFRVQEFSGWGHYTGTATCYWLVVNTPLWGGGGTNSDTVWLNKKVGETVTFITTVHPPEGVIHDRDNIVEIEVVGGNIKAAVNGIDVLEYTDRDPILTGGVGLGAAWEAMTRYDYITVRSVIQILNDFVTFDPNPSTYKPTTDTSGCHAGAVGKFSFDATLTNIGEKDLSNLNIEVDELTNNNLLLTNNGLIGEDERFEVSKIDGYGDGYLSADEYVVVPFTVCLKTKKPFRFFVNVAGDAAD
jgi:hypothetical protein